MNNPLQKDLFSFDFSNIDMSLNTTITGAAGNLSSGTYTITDSTGGYNYNYTNGITGIDTITIGDWSNVSPNTLDVKGDANFEGDVKIKGKSLVDSLEKIEEKLAILRPNPDLEEKWDKLRDLRKQYMELEKEIIEKEKMWDILKK